MTVAAVETGGRPLVVCYGNLLRGDDGVAWRVADRLAADPRLGHVDVLARHQLTPELAADLSRATRVVFVDACVSSEPGAVVRSAVPVRGGSDHLARWSHHLTPEALAGLAAVVYGRVLPVDVVTVGGVSFAAGERLSPAVERALPATVEAVAALLTGCGRS